MQQSTAEIPLRIVGKKGTNPLPIIDKLWEFYSIKGIKTVFISLGTSSSPLAELEIGEILGSPIHIIEFSETKRELWNTISEILKTRKRSDNSSFTEEVETKWILPKNLRITNKLPYFFNGSIELSGNLVETIKWDTYVQEICEAMNITPRIDLLNIQLNGFDESILYSFINTCFRPGLILISYTNTPDSNLLTTQVAGHLHNIGYQLIAKENNKFL